MKATEIYDGGAIKNKHCKHCAPYAALMSKEQMRKDWANHVVKIEGISKQEAEEKVDKEMAKMSV